VIFGLQFRLRMGLVWSTAVYREDRLDRYGLRMHLISSYLRIAKLCYAWAIDDGFYCKTRMSLSMIPRVQPLEKVEASRRLPVRSSGAAFCERDS
jgi:hypothetical protein